MHAIQPELPLAVAVMGPTASGKSALAMALAQRTGAEIVSVDSAQVYRGMDVGTAKPDAAERAQVPHHLVDLIEPTEAYSAARFRSDAIAAAQSIQARGRLPLLVGGTMLYFKALREGLSDLPDADPQLRASIDAEAAREGWPALHARLCAIDPITGARLQPGDTQRIQRALELYHLTGLPPSELYEKQSRRRAPALPFRLLEIALEPSDRGALHQRIARRFDAMLAGGLVEELQALRQKHALRAELPAMRAVGYRQAWEYLEGILDRNGLRERGIYATRQLAKRQLTWLRPLPAARFDCLAPALLTQVWDWLAPRIDGPETAGKL